MKLPRCILLLVPFLGLALGAQTLADRFKEHHKAWEASLERGDGASVRKAAEALLQKEGLTVGRSDYNEMRALVAVLDMAARACVADGTWEDAVAYLQKARDTADENATNTETTFSRIRKEHEEKLAEWKEAVAKAEARVKELDGMTGLSQELMKQREGLKDFLDGHRNAIAHSTWSIQEIDGLLERLKKDKDADAKSLAAWQAFLAREKQDIEAAGTVQQYVQTKLLQVKADEARPRWERIAYGRRLLRLDPANRDCRKFVNELLGFEEPPEAPPAPKPVRKPKAKPAPKAATP